MNTVPRVSGDLDAYRFYIEFALCWTCSECDRHIAASSDIHEDEEDAPYGPWQDRQAREAMKSGWYVQPLMPDGSLVTGPCYCPDCARAKGRKILNQTETSGAAAGAMRRD